MAERASKKAKSSKGSSSSEKLFSSHEQETRYKKNFALRSVAQGRYVDVNFFEEERFNFMPKLKESGLYKLIMLKESYSETVVKAFYSNLTWDDEEKCMLSEVRGKIIKVNHENCLFNKGGNTSHASAVEQFAMYCIMTDTKFNIMSLMIDRMMRCTRVTNVSLFYASLVTLILEKYKINPYEGDIKNPIPIDGNSVSRSGHTKYFNSWVLKENTSQRRKRMEEMEGHEAPAASAENLGSPSQLAPQDSSDILSAIRSVQATVDRRFDALEARMDRRFDAVKGRFDTMTRRLQALELTVADHTTDIKDVLSHLDNISHVDLLTLKWYILTLTAQHLRFSLLGQIFSKVRNYLGFFLVGTVFAKKLSELLKQWERFGPIWRTLLVALENVKQQMLSQTSLSAVTIQQSGSHPKPEAIICTEISPKRNSSMLSTNTLSSSGVQRRMGRFEEPPPCCSPCCS
ncbi:hypothetical protein G2W53_008298 [Senna tora]|uniref:Uncharacterized protein n=1 Tax=Senna tora TaxID=362788 RepID=A0A835CEI6_9FABA|nr:hypothetical protein G2W53_008298 [Senna tora]